MQMLFQCGLRLAEKAQNKPTNQKWLIPGGVLLGIFFPNPDPISDQKMPFPTPVFRPGFKNPYPFSDLTLYVIKHNR